MTPPPATEPAPSPSRSWWSAEPWVAAGLVFAAVAAAAYHCGYLAVPIVDDAAISIAYGHTFFAGHGFRVTPSSQPVEGFSNLLWTLMLGLSRPLGTAPDTYAHTLGVLFGLLALPVFAAWGPVAARRSPRLEDALGPWVAAASTTYATWISSGMETGLQAFLLALSGLLLLRELRTNTGAWAGLALGLLCLTRPEGLLYVVAAGLVWLSHQALERRWSGRQARGIALWLVVLVGGWFVVRWAYFADWLPNTYYAKRFWSFDGPRYLRNYYAENGRLCLLAAAGLVLGMLGGAATARQAMLAALFLLAGGFFAWRNGDWMREWRFLAPLVPLLGVGLAAGVAGARERAPWLGARGLRWRWVARGVVAVGVVAMLVELGAWMKKSVMRAPHIRANPELPYEFIANRLRVVQERARALGQVHPLVAYPDLGGQSMVLREGEIIDVAGLGDYAMAHHSNNPAAMEDYLVSEGPPSFLDVHGPSRHLIGFRTLMPRFHSLGEDRWELNGLSPTEDPRCPGG